MKERRTGKTRAAGSTSIKLDDAYLRAVKKLESLPQNRSGAPRIPVARLSDIVESKRRAGRDKDRLEAIRDLMKAEDQRAEQSRGRKRRTPPRPKRER